MSDEDWEDEVTEVTRARLELQTEAQRVHRATLDSQLERELKEYAASIPSSVPPKR